MSATDARLNEEAAASRPAHAAGGKPGDCGPGFCGALCRPRAKNCVITGWAKSGIVARRSAATFSSIGMALYLTRSDALHGDLGSSPPKTWLLLALQTGRKPRS